MVLHGAGEEGVGQGLQTIDIVRALSPLARGRRCRRRPHSCAACLPAIHLPPAVRRLRLLVQDDRSFPILFPRAIRTPAAPRSAPPTTEYVILTHA